MKIPIIKKWLSYLTDISVVRIPSEHSGFLDLKISQGRYQLCTSNAIYSYADKYRNFAEVFEKTNLISTPVKDVLLLGMGLGSIPFILEKKFGLMFNYTAIEIDEAVIFLASKYTLDDLDSSISIIQADAASYVWQTEDTFDMICVDVFQDDDIPADLLTPEFAAQLKLKLNPNGFIISNHLALYDHEKLKSEKYYNEIFSSIFPNGKYLIADTNMMMISDRSRLAFKSK